MAWCSFESLAPGVDSQGGNPLELLQAHGFEALARLFGHCSPYLLLEQSLRANRTPNCMDLAGSVNGKSEVERNGTGLFRPRKHSSQCPVVIIRAGPRRN